MSVPEDDELREFREQVAQYLIKYGDLDQSVAREIVEKDDYLSREEDLTETQKLVVLHDGPYYYAMMLLHGKTNPEWYHDPKLWPPPDETLPEPLRLMRQAWREHKRD